MEEKKESSISSEELKRIMQRCQDDYDVTQKNIRELSRYYEEMNLKEKDCNNTGEWIVGFKDAMFLEEEMKSIKEQMDENFASELREIQIQEENGEEESNVDN